MSARAAHEPTRHEPGAAPAEELGAAAGELAELHVLGMTCAACVRRVERALGRVPGVHEAQVNLVTHKASVRFDAAQVEREQLAEAVRKAGYEVPVVSAVRAEESAPEADAAAGLAVEGAAPRGPSADQIAAAAEAAELASLRRSMRWAWALTLPLMALAMSHGAIAWAETPAGLWTQLLLATPVVCVAGARFFRLAWAALRHRSADMNSLVALGVGSAYLYSVAALLGLAGGEHAGHAGHVPALYFESAAAIVAFVLLGRWLEARARAQLGSAVRALIALRPEQATLVLGDGSTVRIAVESLRAGQIVRVVPGERIAADARVLRGSSAVDESMLTGESLPLDKAEGAELFAGTLNQTGVLEAEVLRPSADSALSRIVRAVEAAQGSRAPIARLADRISAVFVPVVLAIAVLAGVAWLLLGDGGAGLALERFVAVLVIACPCALGLATPAAIAVGTGRAAELGVLFRSGPALEALSAVDSILLDKTGTLTEGKPQLTAVSPQPGVEPLRLLQLAAQVELGSEHPIAKAVVEGARARGLEPTLAERVRAHGGRGVEGWVDGSQVRIGQRDWLRQQAIEVGSMEAEAERLAAQGQTPFFVAQDDAPLGLIAVADRPAAGAASALAALRGLGLELTMLSGDRQATARAVARELGLTQVVAEVLPEQKLAQVQALQAEGRTVAMVGDGLNDAPALAGADVGVAVAHGTDVALAAADVALLRGGLSQLPVAVELSRATLHTIRQNLFWAFVYNALGIPLAAGLLYPLTGWLLSPMVASAAMSLSSVSVVLNSLRLRRRRLHTAAPARSS